MFDSNNRFGGEKNWTGNYSHFVTKSNFYTIFFGLKFQFLILTKRFVNLKKNNFPQFFGGKENNYLENEKKIINKQKVGGENIEVQVN